MTNIQTQANELNAITKAAEVTREDLQEALSGYATAIVWTHPESQPCDGMERLDGHYDAYDILDWRVLDPAAIREVAYVLATLLGEYPDCDPGQLGAHLWFARIGSGVDFGDLGMEKAEAAASNLGEAWAVIEDGAISVAR